jgi:hypothetical protein
MRKINKDILPFGTKINNQARATKTTRANRITFALNANLCQQAENVLNSR